MHKKAAILFWNIARPVTVQVQTATIVLYISAFTCRMHQQSVHHIYDFWVEGVGAIIGPRPGRFTNHPNFLPIMPYFTPIFWIFNGESIELVRSKIAILNFELGSTKNCKCGILLVRIPFLRGPKYLESVSVGLHSS